MRTIPELKKGTHRAKASGTLPNGKPVVVNADGTVSVISETDVSQVIGSGVVFNTGDSNPIQGVYDAASGKVVLAYKDFGNSPRNGEIVVGTVSGTSISFGTPVAFTTAAVDWLTLAYDANAQKVVVSYADQANSNYGTAKVGTVSGTTISFGTATVFESTGIGYITSTYDETSQKVVVIYKNNTDNGIGIVGTVSGTSISFGSSTSFTTSNTDPKGVTYDANSGKVVVVFRRYATGGEVAVGTVSGTSISFGTAVVFTSAALDYADIVYDASAQKVVVLFADAANSDYGTARVGTVSGTSITLGSSVVIATVAFATFYGSYNAAAKKVLVTYKDSSNSNRGKFVTGTVSGTSISFDTAVTFNTASTPDGSFSLYDPDAEKIIIAYRDQALSNYGTAKVVQNAYTATNLTSENYIGMSQGVVIPTVTGSKVSFESSTMGSEYIGATYDPDTGKIILAYQDQGNSYYGTAVVGTVSGTSISFGTPVVFQASKTKDFCAVYDTANDKVVITYCNEASFDAGTGIVGTVSGTSISFGSPAVFDSSGAGTPHSSVYDTNAGKVVVFYRDTSDSSKGKASVGTVSGTSISWGSLVNFNGNDYTNSISASYDSTAQKIVVCFADLGNSTYGSSVVGTVSGTSISFGTKVVFSSSSTEDAFAAYDSANNKTVVTYKDGGDSDKGKAAVGTVSGTSISFGTPVQFISHVGSNYNCAYDAQAESIIINYGSASAKGQFITGKVSGTSIGSFSSPVFYYSATNRVIRPQLVIDGGTGNAVFSFKDQDDSSKGSSTVTSIGSVGQVNAGSSATVDIIGSVSTNQSGLTAGQQYYVQTDGTIGETAADPSVFAGTAISATSLVVKT